MDKTFFLFDRKEIEGWKVRLAMLCQSCPVHGRHPDFCPLLELSKLKPGDQIDFIKTLPVDALRYVLARHEVCMENEVGKSLKDALVSSNADSYAFYESVQVARA